MLGKHYMILPSLTKFTFFVHARVQRTYQCGGTVMLPHPKLVLTFDAGELRWSSEPLMELSYEGVNCSKDRKQSRPYRKIREGSSLLLKQLLAKKSTYYIPPPSRGTIGRQTHVDMC